jgi:hypothetical protein
MNAAPCGAELLAGTMPVDEITLHDMIRLMLPPPGPGALLLRPRANVSLALNVPPSKPHFNQKILAVQTYYTRISTQFQAMQTSENHVSPLVRKYLASEAVLP